MTSDSARHPPERPADDATVISRPDEAGGSWSGSAATPAPGRPATTTSDIGQLLQGTTLGPYRLDEFIGGGGMGAVFRAIDTTLDRIVAVKVLAGRQADDEEMLKRFRNEAQSAARLDHENIGRVHAVGTADGWHYIVFEYIEGTNLRDLVRERGPFSVAATVDIAMQIADALEHASERDVVHRDIKPSNIVITPAGRARIVDMGLARLHHLADDQDLTVSGMTLGTFDYISPEQARDPRAADVRSDLYSLGCTIFFMLTGRPPFADGTMVQKLLQHQQTPPPLVDDVRPDIPHRLAAIVARLMAKDPDDRYQRPAVLAADLAAFADEAGLEAEDADVHQAQRRRASRLPWMVPLAGLLVVVALAWGRSATERRSSPAGTGGATAATAAPTTVLVSAGATGPADAPTLAAAIRLVGDGGTVELADRLVRVEEPLSLAGKRVAVVAATGVRPVIEFAAGELASADTPVACDVGDGALLLRGVAIRLAERSDRHTGAGVFRVAGGRLACEDVVLRTPGNPTSDAPRSAEPTAAFVVAQGVETKVSAISMVRCLAAGDAVFLHASPTVSGTVTMEWDGGEFVSPRRLVVADGVASGQPHVDCSFHDATFCCGDGIIASEDSLDRPEPPRLRIRASGCRFVVTGHDRPFVLQAGVGEPDRYRAALTWIDEGSRYEGHAVFQRIDGAAERIDVGFRDILPPLAHDEAVGDRPTPEDWTGW
jgi:hypothetical protein